MKILLLHADYLKFKAIKKALKNPEKAGTKEEKIKECLVVFTAVEKRDEKDTDNSVKKLVNEIGDVSDKVKTKNIVLYPYAHLSSDLSSPDKAVSILNKTEKVLKKKKYKVKKAPFGWYKAFEIKVKGHPLSELSREFGPEKEKKEESESLKKERKLTSYWHILDTKGKLHDVGKFNYNKHENLKKFAVYEKEKSRAVKKDPPHVDIMRKLELVDYEPASDSGNLRYYPKGRLVKKLIERYVTKRVIEYGGLEVETPIMYDIKHPTLSKYLQRFPARQYRIESDKREFFLRFAACFGQFLMANDATLSYRSLPFRPYELTRYSFRREQTGELTGLRRLRAFTMPDVHAIVKDMKQAKEEYKKRFDLSLSVLKNIGIGKEDIEMALRTTKDFFRKNKEFIVKFVKKLGKPVLLELWDERIFYFVLKYEFNFVDNLNKASALSTDQIDIENGERYGIKFMDKDGKKKHPLILHCSPSGAIERVMYALLEKSAFDEKKGKKPMLPLWLSPTQIRIIPVSPEKHLKHALKLTEEFEKENIRVDIDDNVETIGKRIRNAEKEWIPYIIVIGDKEIKSKKLPVRIRETGKQENMSRKEIIKKINEKTKEMPFEPLPLPKLLSKRPIFIG
ncbi:threonine--tRNA ligase [Candidatus Woesearchaeota archaeon]|nr:threonine--tRNA ligase [Candidatus Woesearchaeota archaeon]